MNKGYEIQFKSDLFRNNDWYVSVFANLAHNKNEILKVSESLKAYNDAVDKDFCRVECNSTGPLPNPSQNTRKEVR